MQHIWRLVHTCLFIGIAKYHGKWRLVSPYLFIGCLMLLLGPAIALAAGADPAMPWDSPLKQIQASLTGPVALAVSIIGVAICGAALVFGGELSEFTKRMVMLVLAISILMGASTLITTLFAT